MLNTFLRERSRARAVAALRVLGARPDPAFGRFTELAASAFAAPAALLTLLHDDELHVPASTGLPALCLPRDQSFCTHALDRGDLLEVCDATEDGRFRHLRPVTAPPHVRYYIGAPLTLADGNDVGALCVIDVRPRPPASRDQRAYLAGLARQATRALEGYARANGGVAT